MLPGGGRITCMVWSMFPGLDLYLNRSCTTSHNDGLDDLDDLDHDQSIYARRVELCAEGG